MVDFYARVPLNRNASAVKKPSAGFAALKRWFDGAHAKVEGSGLRPEIVSPAKVANIMEIAEARKREQFESVSLPENPPVGTNAAYEKWAKTNAKCETLLKRAG